jgi:hypothetical protein
LTEADVRATYTRLYADAQGISRFEDLELDLIPGFAMPPAEPLHLARFAPAERCYWLGAPADWKGDAAHPTPRRQILVTIQGEYEVSAGDGTKRRFPVGSVVLVEDTTGSGHSTRITSANDALVFAVGLPPDDTA